MEYDFSFGTIWETMKYAVHYLPQTLAMSIIPCTIAFILGSLIALAKYRNMKGLSAIGEIFVLISKGIPVLLLMLLCYYGIFGLIDQLADKFSLGFRSKSINQIYIAIFALSLYGTGYLVETMRSALLSVGYEQLEAGYSVGMTTWQSLRRIIIPQIMPAALPNLCNNLTATVKLSAMGFTISVVDMFNSAMIYTSISHCYIEAYIAAGILYWLLSFGIERVFGVLEKKANSRAYILAASNPEG